MRERLTLLFCAAALLTVSADASASTPEERSWEQKQAGGLSVSRHAVATASVNVTLLPYSAATWLVNAPIQSTVRWRRMSYAIGSATTATAAANLGWLVVAGMSLSDYREQSGEWMTLRRARTNVGFVAVDTTFRTMNLIGGVIAVSRGNGYGFTFIYPNALLLPFHAWALSTMIRELRYRKRETRAAARRVQPISSGFRF